MKESVAEEEAPHWGEGLPYLTFPLSEVTNREVMQKSEHRMHLVLKLMSWVQNSNSIPQAVRSPTEIM
jgi:hypothetical protein